jgi:DNA-binding transcriptional MerR regulator
MKQMKDYLTGNSYVLMSQVAKDAGITLSMMTYYTQRGLAPKPTRYMSNRQKPVYEPKAAADAVRVISERKRERCI